MNNYETFRDELFMELSLNAHGVTMQQIYTILNIVDRVAKTYEISKMTTDIITVEDGVPSVVKYFIASKAVEQKSKGTLQNYTLVLSNFFRTVGKGVKDVTPNDVRVYLHQYMEERKVKGNTMEMIRHVFNSFFAWCYAEEYVLKNPMIHIGAIKADTKEREALEPIELEYIRKACRNEREKAIIDFLFSTGCRVSEMCNIKYNDVDFEKRTVFIRNGKGGKDRTTFINPESMVSLKAYLPHRMNDSTYLFTHSKHLGDVGCSKKSVEILLRKIVARCPQIKKKVTPHVMRHTAATIALRNGMPLEQVKEFLGHSNLNTTMIYAKIDKEEVKRSHDKFLG